MFSPWNSLEVKNLNYKTQAYQTIIKYYRENSCKAIKHYMFIFICVLPITNYSEILRIKS